MADPEPMDDFQAAWHRLHPNSHPVFHRLKDAPGWNMTRFHALPGGHTVAATNNQLRDMLARLNRIATATLGDGAPCYLMMLRSGNENQVWRTRMDRMTRIHGLRPGWQFFSAGDKLTYTVWWTRVAWQSEAFNRLLLHIYRRDLMGVLFMNCDTGAVFNPYDAGADVSQPTPQELIALISQFYGWMSDETGFIRFNPAQMQGVRFEVTPSCAAAINRVIQKR
jgi:hypothetical protein